ncbi:hypothetical protein BST61_g6829 [Cercospora zeina]
MVSAPLTHGSSCDQFLPAPLVLDTPTPEPLQGSFAMFYELLFPLAFGQLGLEFMNGLGEPQEYTMYFRWKEARPEHGTSQRHIVRPLFVYTLLFSTALLAVASLFLSSIRNGLSTSFTARPFGSASIPQGLENRWEDCGGTPEEARRRGCHFDVLSMAWQTHECMDHANAAAFLAHHETLSSGPHALHLANIEQKRDEGAIETTWKFYLDGGAQHEVPLSVVLNGTNDIYVTQEYHYVHCTYMWRQMHRAYTILGHIDEHLDNWLHTLHCQNVLLAGMGNKEEIGAVGKIIYPKCLKVGEKRTLAQDGVYGE